MTKPQIVRHIIVIETMEGRSPTRGDLEMVQIDGDHFREDILTLKAVTEFPDDDDFDYFEDADKLEPIEEWERDEGIYGFKQTRADWEFRMRMIKTLRETISFLKKDWPKLPDKIDGYME